MCLGSVFSRQLASINGIAKSMERDVSLSMVHHERGARSLVAREPRITRPICEGSAGVVDKSHG